MTAPTAAVPNPVPSATGLRERTTATAGQGTLVATSKAQHTVTTPERGALTTSPSVIPASFDRHEAPSEPLPTPAPTRPTQVAQGGPANTALLDSGGADLDSEPTAPRESGKIAFTLNEFRDRSAERREGRGRNLSGDAGTAAAPGKGVSIVALPTEVH